MEMAKALVRFAAYRSKESCSVNVSKQYAEISVDGGVLGGTWVIFDLASMAIYIHSCKVANLHNPTKQMARINFPPAHALAAGCDAQELARALIFFSPAFSRISSLYGREE